jgi:hypothetical protein
MSGTAHGARTEPREGIVFAIILIAVGVGALAMQAMPDAGSSVVLLIGLGLLAAFAFLREYGALIPGGIMTGLGAGILASQTLAINGEATGGVIVLGLGLGFISIWVIGAIAHVAEHHPWPLVPGGILTIIGVSQLVGGQAMELMRFWPVAVIAIGLIVLWRAWLETRARS